MICQISDLILFHINTVQHQSITKGRPAFIRVIEKVVFPKNRFLSWINPHPVLWGPHGSHRDSVVYDKHLLSNLRKTGGPFVIRYQSFSACSTLKKVSVLPKTPRKRLYVT